MTANADITLPPLPEGWDEQATLAYILRDYARAAVEADRAAQMNDDTACIAKLSESDKQDHIGGVTEMVPSNCELLALSNECKKMPGGLGMHYANYGRAVLSRYGWRAKPSNSGELGQPAASPEPVPDIPVGCEMTRNWSVTVCAEGADTLTISSEYVAGVSDLEPWRSTIRGCAQHLLSFVGEAAPVAQEPVAWVRPDLVVNGKIQASSFTAHTNYRDGYVPLSLAAPVAAQVQPEGVTLDGCLETLFVIGEYLGVDYAASRKAPGAPSGVYIKAIEDRVAAQPSAQDRDDAQ